MSTIDAFLRENVEATEETKEVKFDRFKAPFVIKSITAAKNEELQKMATKKTRDKRTNTIVTDVNQNRYIDLLMAESVVEPNLNDEKIQKSWDALADPAGVIKNMLKIGEYTELASQIQELSGFEAESIDDLVDDVKN